MLNSPNFLLSSPDSPKGVNLECKKVILKTVSLLKWRLDVSFLYDMKLWAIQHQFKETEHSTYVLVETPGEVALEVVKNAMWMGS